MKGLRAAHADREHAIGLLKNAFVQGMLDKDEFDPRVGQAFASRTYAELAAVTGDLPAPEPVPAPAAQRPSHGRGTVPASRQAAAAAGART